MIGQMGIAIALPGYNDLVRSVTPILLFMDHFLCRFSTLSKKIKKFFRVEVSVFCKCIIELFLALRLSVQRLQMPLEGLRFVDTIATFGIINATDSLIQNITGYSSLTHL